MNVVAVEVDVLGMVEEETGRVGDGVGQLLSARVKTGTCSQ